MSQTILRPYQTAAVDALCGDLERGVAGLVAVPTGAGKSLILGATADRFVQRGQHVLVLAPAAELIEQDARAFRSLNPKAMFGVVCASLGRCETGYAVTFATPGTAINADVGRIDVVLIDEAHRLGPDENSQLSAILRRLRAVNSTLCLGGVTATPFRGDGGYLIEGPNFERLSFEIGYVDLVGQGYLSKIVGPKGGLETRFNLDGVRTRAGDFVASDLSDAFDQDDLNRAVARQIAQHGRERRAGLIFAVDIAHAERLAAEMRRIGEDCRVVTGATPTEVRRKTFERYRSGEVKYLAGCEVFTTGFDAPRTDVIALCRPTTSPVLHVQMVGRGTRIAPGKSDCLVLDFGGNFERVGPFDAPTVGQRRLGRDAPALTKHCFHCDAVVSIAARSCPFCAARLVVEEKTPHVVDIAALPDANATLLRGEGGWRGSVRVLSMKAARHVKPGAADSLRLDYTLADGRIEREWLACWSSNSYAAWNARREWHTKFGMPVPRDAAEAVGVIHTSLGRLTPRAIRVTRKGASDRFPKIDFANARAAVA